MQPSFQIERFYLKQCSLDLAPQITELNQQSQVQLSFNLDISNQQVKSERVEVTLTLDAQFKQEEIELARLKLQQAGLFTIQNYDADSLTHILQAYCPNLLFPYLRERAAELAMHAGLPSLNLAPIDFFAVNQQQAQNSNQKQSSTKAEQSEAA